MSIYQNEKGRVRDPPYRRVKVVGRNPTVIPNYSRTELLASSAADTYTIHFWYYLFRDIDFFAEIFTFFIKKFGFEPSQIIEIDINEFNEEVLP